MGEYLIIYKIPKEKFRVIKKYLLFLNSQLRFKDRCGFDEENGNLPFFSAKILKLYKFLFKIYDKYVNKMDQKYGNTINKIALQILNCIDFARRVIEKIDRRSRMLKLNYDNIYSVRRALKNFLKVNFITNIKVTDESSDFIKYCIGYDCDAIPYSQDHYYFPDWFEVKERFKIFAENYHGERTYHFVRFQEAIDFAQKYYGKYVLIAEIE